MAAAKDLQSLKNDKTIEERHKKALLSIMASNYALMPEEWVDMAKSSIRIDALVPLESCG